MSPIVFALTALAVTVACAPGPAPVSQSPKDPSNPAAAEGVSAPQPMLASMTRPAAPVADASDSHAGHLHGATPVASVGSATADGSTPAVVYTCPMHAQITSPTPGRCPICGMNLVPNK